MVKWLGAIFGYLYGRFPGAILGFLVGSAIEYFLKRNASTSSFQQVFQQSQQVSPGDFELNLLSLASLVIKADGNVNQQEMEFVRSYFVRAYGKDRANATFRTFNEVIKKREVSANRICLYLRQRTRYEVRLQILHFLFNIAQADGVISQAELHKLAQIAGFLQLGRPDFESIKAMFYQSADTAYKILEIEKTATDEEVKRAYRTMAKKYHPDKLQHMDDAYLKGAQEKFTKVQDAYEKIQKERDF